MGAVGNFGSEYCHHCQHSCTDYNYGPCVFYRGPEISHFNVKDWKESDRTSLQEVCTKIGLGVQDYIQKNYVNPDGYPYKDMLPGEAAELALELLADLDSDKIKVKNSLFCLGRTSSVYSAVLGTRGIIYSVSATERGHSNLTYNMEEAIKDLPADYIVSRKEVEAFSYNPTTSLDSRLVKTNDLIGQFQLRGDQFPIALVFTLDIGTPAGLVTMSKRITLDAPQPQDSSAILEVEDRTSKNSGSGLSQTQYNELLEAAICQLNARMDSNRFIGLAGCKKVTYHDKSIGGATAVHSGHICTIYSRLDNIGEEKIQAIDCDQNCEKRTYETTIQEFGYKTGNDICALKLDIRTILQELETLKLKVATCCRDASAGIIDNQD